MKKSRFSWLIIVSPIAKQRGQIANLALLRLACALTFLALLEVVSIAQAQGPGKAIQFDGVDQYVYVFKPIDWGITNSSTWETWVRPDSINGEYGIFTRFGQYGTPPANHYVSVNQVNSNIVANIKGYDGDLATITASGVLYAGAWRHITVVIDSATLTANLYIDGKTEASWSVSVTSTKAGITGDFDFGRSGGPGGVYDYFAGQIDEVRVFNVAKTQAQIQADMHKGGDDDLTYPDGLGGRYHLNDDANDSTSPAENGALVNLPTYTDSYASIGDSASASGEPWDFPGTDVSFTTVTDAPDAQVTVGRISQHPTIVGSLPEPVVNISNVQYWMINIAGASTHNVEMDFTIDNEIGVINSATLHILRRQHAGEAWSDLGVVLSSPPTTVTIPYSDAFGYQFCIGGESDNPLPVELLLFTAISGNDTVTLTWVTASEMNNLGFNIYRSESADGNFIKINGKLIAGALDSGARHEYQFVDTDVQEGVTYYYYIEDISATGLKNRSQMTKVSVKGTVPKLNIKGTTSSVILPSKPMLLQNFPNAFNPDTWVPYELSEDAVVKILIHNTKGELVKTINLGQKSAGFYLTKENAAYWDGKNDRGEIVASGIYYYTLLVKNFSATRKMALLK